MALFDLVMSGGHVLCSLLAVCEMCGIVGTREAFFSKTKRFCSVSCSRSYSSNSKKASILARLQVREPLHPSWGLDSELEPSCDWRQMA